MAACAEVKQVAVLGVAQKKLRKLATTIFKRTATGGHGFVLQWGWVSGI
jgi:hypothetical protein